MPPRKRKLDADVDSGPRIPIPPRWIIKPKDGDPLTREDLQMTLLTLLFQDTEFRFTPPAYPNALKALFPTDRTWSFAELYLDCLANSSKANKNLKDKMGESTSYAVSFAQLCFLINIGRMNTTLAFYPEMKTALRTYHPIPCMQLDDYTKRHLQDAPRMKAQLKGCALPQDGSEVSATLAEVLRRGTDLRWKPPSCVVVLIFLMMDETLALSDKYFPEGYSLQDLFLPAPPEQAIPSEERAKAFLYLTHRFLEHPHDAFDDFKLHVGKLPADRLLRLSRPGNVTEDADSIEEIAFAQSMKQIREAFVDKSKTDVLAVSLNGSPAPQQQGVEPPEITEERHTTDIATVNTPAVVSDQAAMAETAPVSKREASADITPRVEVQIDPNDPRIRPFEIKILDDEYMPIIADPVERTQRPPGQIGQLVDDPAIAMQQRKVGASRGTLRTALQIVIDSMQTANREKREPWHDSDDDGTDVPPMHRTAAVGFRFQNYSTGRKSELR